MSPFKTLAHAQKAVRNLKMSDDNINGDVTIYLRGGEYILDDTLELSLADSGTLQSNLVISGYGNEKVSLIGGKTFKASDFSNAPIEIQNKIIDTNARTKIKYINLPSIGISNFGEITRRGKDVTSNKIPQGEFYINGKRQKLARWPNENFVSRSSVLDYGSKANIEQGCSFYYADYERPDFWENPELVWISGAMRANYAYDYFPLKSIDKANNLITLKEGYLADYYTDSFFFFENILEELDSKDEYYLDRITGNLYAYFDETIKHDDEVSFSITSNDMIKLSGVSNVILKNIEIAYGRKSAIVADKKVENIQIQNCNIHGFGFNGIALSDAQNSTVRDCKIYDVGKSGVSVSGGDYNNIVSSSNLIYNNDIYNFATLEKSYNAGVWLGYQSVGTKVLNNYIHDGPHTGLIFYGVNHIIANNEFAYLVKEFLDMDAIYVNNVEMPWERGTVISNNYFHDIGNYVINGHKQINISAIRTDNNGNGLTICHNLFYNIGKGKTNQVSAIRAQGAYNKIYYNTFIDCSEAYNSNNTYNPNSAYPPNEKIANNLLGKLNIYGMYFPELKNYWNEHPSVVKTNVFHHNAIINLAFPLSTINGEQNPQGFRGASQLVDAYGNYVTTKNPGFKDYQNSNFTFSDDAQIYNEISGYSQVNLEAIGLK